MEELGEVRALRAEGALADRHAAAVVGEGGGAAAEGSLGVAEAAERRESRGVVGCAGYCGQMTLLICPPAMSE